MKKPGFPFSTDLRRLWAPSLILLGIMIWFFVPIGWPRYRANGLRANCQENLRQMAAAIRQYSQDWDGRLPPVAINAVARTKANPKLAYGWADATRPYLKSTDSLQCPSITHEVSSRPWEAGYTDYYFNSQIQRLRLGEVANDHHCVLLGETTADLKLRTSRFFRHSIPDSWRQGENSPANVHLLGANYAFVDGHVKWIQYPKSPQDCPAGTGSAFVFCPWMNYEHFAGGSQCDVPV